MNLSDEELVLYAIREAQLILADYAHPGRPQTGEAIVRDLMAMFDRNDVVEAVDRMEAKTGMRLA